MDILGRMTLPILETPRGPRAAGLHEAFPHAHGLVLRRARGRDDWNAVRAVRYEALRRKDDIPDRAEASHADPHDSAANATTFLLACGDRPIGTTRSSVRCASRRWPLPSQGSFAREIDEALGREATVVEASLTLVHPDADFDPKLALIHLLRAHMAHCAAEDADWLVAAVRESQIGFHRRMFGMDILSGAERCEGLAMPRVLMGLAYREMHAVLSKRIPAVVATPLEEREFETGRTA
jgi:hypothetical protein